MAEEKDNTIADALTKAVNNCFNMGALSQQVSELAGRANNHADRLRTIEVQNAVSEERNININTNLEAIKTNVEEIKNKPAKRMDSIWGYVVAAIIAAIVSIIASKF